MKTAIFSFLATIVLVGCNSSDNDLNKSVSFETIEKNMYSGVVKAQSVVVTNINDWEELWDQTVNWTPDELPFVNFNESMVVAVYMGEQVSGGYDVEVQDIKEADDIIEVALKFTNPESGEGVTLALTQPFHMIKINKTDKKIVFREQH